ncbi:hypothetical protein M0638_25060 [Roseomonas sp. NAR14]|uniref:Uncharacterized protein n=1 Tax=Roseomonas acroporae TaxID=2937791 RepID=A0A9X1YCI8_9PROT|nr:hypothetical protein [Roseomonas acroporae]MCK8787641.1 hypothetical protein [Roseomonas acroporae]
MSTREAALAGLLAAIQAQAPAGCDVQRDDGNADALPQQASLIVIGAGAVESEAVLSPLSYCITLQPEVTVAAYQPADLDAALGAIVDAYAVDPTLGGAIDGWLIGDPTFTTVTQTEPLGGQDVPLPPFQAAQVPLQLFYSATSPLG